MFNISKETMGAIKLSTLIVVWFVFSLVGTGCASTSAYAALDKIRPEFHTTGRIQVDSTSVVTEIGPDGQRTSKEVRATSQMSQSAGEMKLNERKIDAVAAVGIAQADAAARIAEARSQTIIALTQGQCGSGYSACQGVPMGGGMYNIQGQRYQGGPWRDAMAPVNLPQCRPPQDNPNGRGSVPANPGHCKNGW